MTTFFTSDQHYYHDNVRRYAGRPYDSMELMNRALIENHNSVVAQNDTVWHLGDFAFTNIDNVIATLRRLNGVHHFVRGNHDKTILQHRNRLLSEHVFASMREDAEIYVEKQFIVLHHYAKRVWNKAHYGAWHLFGHSHGTMPPMGKSVDVGVDSPWITGKAEYRPYSFEELRDYMSTREFKSEDRHQEM
jgi:calcineurin-like phosphoesterase family protein